MSITICDSSKCTGCGACLQSCPKKAISFLPDKEGFPSPVIDDKSCVECGICSKVCPVNNSAPRETVKKAYAIQSLDKEMLKNSTSGGAFTTFAREIFSRGGVVYGCVWGEKYDAVIVKAEKESDISPMRGSKYVWSSAYETFPEIKQYLDSGRVVLFTGLSCQVAGLRKYLKKEYENLYTLDFMCGGAPSPKAFQSYISTLVPSLSPKDGMIFFREKGKGGVGVNIILHKSDKSSYLGGFLSNDYYYSFYSKMIVRRSCYKCLYYTDARVSDLTMGDYWGVSNYHSDMDVKSGVSALLVNTEKGAGLFASVKSAFDVRETDAVSISKANNFIPGEGVREIHVPASREAFFKSLDENGWDKTAKRFLHTKKRLYLKLSSKHPFVKKISSLVRKVISR